MSSEVIDGLSPRMRALYAALDGKGEVGVTDIYKHMWGEPGDKTEREQAQKVGNYVSRLNDKIEPMELVVEPGTRKYTYTLAPL